MSRTILERLTPGIIIAALLLFSVAGASEHYTRPFIFPGRYQRYYRQNLSDKMLDIDFNSHKSCAVKLFVDSQEVYTRALEMFESAEKSIYFNMYLFGGSIGDRILDILERKMAEGVDVRLILSKPKFQMPSLPGIPGLSGTRGDHIDQPQEDLYNHYGYYDPQFRIASPDSRNSPKPPYREKVSEALARNLPVVFAEPRFLKGFRPIQVDHNKIILIDGVQAMVGGMNFADTVAANRDSMLEVIGPLVEEIEKIFINSWILGFANEYDNMRYYNENLALAMMVRKANEKGYILAEAFPTVTAPYAYNTLEPLLELINSARESVYIAQLLFNEETLIEAVARAAARGVDVRIIVDPAIHLYSLDWKGGPNNKLLGTFQQLQGADSRFNGEVRHYAIKPGQELHSKLIIVDSRFTGTGSTNFASNAFDANYETFFFFDSPELAADYSKMFLYDWERRSIIPEKLGFIENLTGFISGLIF